MPERLGGFEVVARLGRRGLVEIVIARAKEGPDGLVRLEHLPLASAKEPELRRALLEAARHAAGLEHPNVARTLGVVEDATGIVVVREHVEGADCAALVAGALRDGGRIPPVVAALIVERSARGVHHAHGRPDVRGVGLVHGGLAPRSIALGLDGAVKVHDHGAATARALCGPLFHLEAEAVYRAPEQTRQGTSDVRSDVFSLGMVLYALLRLGTPHGGPEGTALLGAVAADAISAALSDLSDVPGPIAPILRRALAMAPDARFSSAAELADALGRAVEALGGAGDREIGALAGRYTGAADEELADESTHRMPAPAGRLGGEARPGRAAEASSTQAHARVEPARAARATTESGPGRDEGTPTGESAPTGPSRPTPTACTLQPGDKFARYVIETRLGRGGTAEVYQAHDSVLQRKVALKLLKSSEDARARARFVREAQSVATFQHPNSVVVFDVGEADGTPYIAMELVRGQPLRAFVGDASIPPPRRLRWLVAVARALGAAHRQGIVHRDVKPSNVMIREDGEVKVLDFGIARRETSWGPQGGGTTLTRQGVIVGTLRYAAPEQLRSEPVDGRADQFAFGMTAFELLAGRPPFPDARAVDVAMRILVDPTPPLAGVVPELPEAVASAIDRALTRSVAGRFPTMDELADVLEPYAEVTTRTTMTLGAGLSSGGYPAVASLLTGTPPPAASGSPASPTAPRAAVSAPVVGSSPLRLHERVLVVFAGVSVSLLLVLVVVVALRGRAAPAIATDAAPNVAVPIASLSCSPATLEGSADAALARAVGVGVCARLGLELGVEWGVAGATAVDVRARPSAGATTITVRVGARESQASGPTVAEAMDAAAALAMNGLAFTPLGPREVAQWGAADEAGARRIARVWQRYAAGMSGNIAVEVQHLIDTDRESPVPYALAALAGAGTMDGSKAAREQAFGRLSRLPPSRAHMLRGALLMRPGALDTAEALRLMRTSYAEAPEDVDMVALYAREAVALGLPEGFQIVDRLVASSPSRALSALRAAALGAPERDLPRSARYAGACIDALPELGASLLVDSLLGEGKLGEAKAAVALGRALGLGTTAGDPLEVLGARIDVALDAGDTAAARESALALLADPRPSVQRVGALAAVGSLIAEGKTSDGLALLVRESERLESLGAIEGVATLLVEHLRLRRWLGQSSPASVRARLASALAAPPGELSPALRAEALSELALTETGKAAAKARAAALQSAGELATRAGDDAVTRDAIALGALALTRLHEGDAAAVASWRKHSSAPFSALQRAAVDAGFAFEATGDASGAARAYQIAETSNTPRVEQAQKLVAGVRLIALGGEPGPEMAARKARVERALSVAEPEIRKALEAGPVAESPAHAPARGAKKVGRGPALRP